MPDCEPTGIGFLVGADLVVTCAHVVAAAVGPDELKLGARVHADFPFIASGEYLPATVVHLDYSGADVACLQIDSIPDTARAVRVVAADDVAGTKSRHSVCRSGG